MAENVELQKDHEPFVPFPCGNGAVDYVGVCSRVGGGGEKDGGVVGFSLSFCSPTLYEGA